MSIFDETLKLTPENELKIKIKVYWEENWNNFSSSYFNYFENCEVKLKNIYIQGTGDNIYHKMNADGEYVIYLSDRDLDNVVCNDGTTWVRVYVADIFIKLYRYLYKDDILKYWEENYESIR